MTQPLDDHAFTVHLDVSYEEALERVTAALKQEGFGIITDIDIRRTLKERIDVDFRKYAILGACNPTLASRALGTDPQVGLLLPCNVIVYEDEGEGDGEGEGEGEGEAGTTVAVVDPLGMLGDIDVPELRDVADEAHARLSRVAAALAS